MKDGIDITISTADIKKMLSECIVTKHKTELSECIMGLLHEENDNSKIKVLYKAITGITTEQLYPLGSELIVSTWTLPTWRFDKPAMYSKNLMKGDVMPVVILKFTKYEENQYTVRFKYINDKGELIVGTDTVSKDQIKRMSDEIISD